MVAASGFRNNFWILCAFVFLLNSCEKFGSSMGDFGSMNQPASTYSEPSDETGPSSDNSVGKINNIPQITFTNPSDGLQVVNNGSIFNIQFNAFDADGIAGVALFYSSDTILCDSNNESDWNVITSDITTAYDSYEWAIPELGVIYICGKVSDDQGEVAVYNKAPGVILSLPSGQVFWVSSDSGITVETGNLVSSWLDKSQSSHNSSQSNINYMPEIVYDAVNGLPLIRFDGINDHFNNDYTYNVKSIFAVVRVLSSNMALSDLGQIFGDYASSVHLALDARSGSNQNGVSLDGANQNVNGGYYTIDNNPYSSYVTNDNSIPWEYDKLHLIRVRFNETRQIQHQVIAHLAHTFNIGDHHYGGDIAEIMVFDRELSAGEEDAVKLYLDNKWFFEAENSEMPQEPQNLNFNSVSHQAIRLIWEPPVEPVSAYQISYKEGEDIPGSCNDGNVVPSSFIGSSNNYLISGLSKNTLYSFRVCSVKNGIPLKMSDGITIQANTLEDELQLPPLDGAVLWLKANEGVITDSDNKVSVWSDLTGFFDALQSDEGNMPVLIENECNGLPMIVFDGIDDYLAGNSSVNLRTVAIVYKVKSTLQNTAQLGQLWGNYYEGTHIAADPRSGNLQGWSFDGYMSMTAKYFINDGDFTSYVRNSNAVKWQYDNPGLIVAEFDSQRNISSYLIATLGAPFSVGQHQFGGGIGEILVYNKVLDAYEIEELRDYLKAKWGI